MAGNYGSKLVTATSYILRTPYIRDICLETVLRSHAEFFCFYHSIPTSFLHHSHIIFHNQFHPDLATLSRKTGEVGTYLFAPFSHLSLDITYQDTDPKYYGIEILGLISRPGYSTLHLTIGQTKPSALSLMNGKGKPSGFRLIDSHRSVADQF